VSAHAVRFGWAQVVLGLGLLAAAGWLGGPAWLLTWPAVAVIVVGTGYLGLGPGVFGKRSDGSLGWPLFALLLPYHAVAWMRLRWDALVHREPLWNEVAPGLFLGRIVPPAAMPPGTTVVVDLTAEFEVSPETRISCAYHCLPALDTSVPRYEEFAVLARALAAHPGPIYVHCAAGHGRSAAFAAALLVTRGLATGADDAEAVLRRARPAVRLHRGQHAMLARFAAESRHAPDPDPQGSSLGPARPLS